MTTFIGNLDTVNQNGDGLFRGWACDLAAPQAVLKILIFRDGEYVGRTTTGTEYRPDAAPYCAGQRNCGWRFVIPAEEYYGAGADWSARIEGIDNMESDYPATWGVKSIHAMLPGIPRVNYIFPYCFWEDATSGITTTPGSRLDTLVSFWNFNTKVNGTTPLERVTTYDAGAYTGVNTTPFEFYLQRGDNRSSGSREADLAAGRPVLQRYCTSAGIQVNSAWLDDLPGEKGGQHGVAWSFTEDRKLNIAPGLRQVIADYQPGRIKPLAPVRRPFAAGASSALVFEGNIKVPSFHTDGQSGASGQANYYVYFWDTRSGNSIAIVINLWDSRYDEEWNHQHRVSFDGVTQYASQSISDSSGLRYATLEAGTWRSSKPNPEDRKFATAEHFQVKVSGENLTNVINDINQASGLALSSKLRDYVLTDAIFGVEISGLMSLGASIANFSVYASR